LKCFDIIDQKPANVLKSDKFLTLSEGTVEDIVKRDTMSCQELDLFHAIVRWGENRAAEGVPLKEVLVRLIEHVRFPLIPAADLLCVVEPKEVVPDHILLEAYRFLSLSTDLKPTLKSARTIPRTAIREVPCFDSSALPATLSISDNWRTVTKRGSSCHVVVLAKQGFSIGVHKWRVKVEGLAGSQWVSVGVARSSTHTNMFADPSHWTFSTVGQVYAGSTHDSGHGVLSVSGHVLELTLNCYTGVLDLRNLQTQSRASLVAPVCTELFPAVGLHTLGNKATFCDSW